MPTLRNHTHCQVAQNASAQTKTYQRVWLPQHTDRLRRIKHENTTMCIIHKGLRGFQALSHASNSVHLDRFEVRNPLQIIVCREAVNRQYNSLHAVIKMVETSCKVDPPVSSCRRGHQTT